MAKPIPLLVALLISVGGPVHAQAPPLRGLWKKATETGGFQTISMEGSKIVLCSEDQKVTARFAGDFTLTQDRIVYGLIRTLHYRNKDGLDLQVEEMRPFAFRVAVTEDALELSEFRCFGLQGNRFIGKFTRVPGPANAPPAPGQ